MPFFIVPFLLLATYALAVEQEQPTPYDLIRPIWPMKWDTAATDFGGTVESFSKYTPNPKKHNAVPAVGTIPQDFVANGYIPDTLNQAFRDAQNLRIGRIRVNQAGYLPEDPEKQFYYISKATCAESYSIVDLLGNEVATGGKLTSTGKKASSSWTIIAGTDAATNEQRRYSATADSPEGTICIGRLSDIPNLSYDTRYRIHIAQQYSSTFIISERVYSMVRDATLKFYGINRSGNSESWFHKPSHTKDGSGSFVNGIAAATGFTSKEGALQGGWYDCGDHLKESQTQAYAFLVLSVMAASNPDRDEDHYAYNMGETINTDGVPDILREAKHGADFFLRSYAFANGVIDNMVVSVGNFGADHGWWGRPENQDALPQTLTGRGGPHERDLRLGELGANISSEIAAGLAILSKDYAIYDKVFADSCLMVAEKLYDFAKNLELGKSSYDGGKAFVYNKMPAGWSSSAYNGNNESYDDLAIAAIALHYATYQKTGKMDYLNDAVENTDLSVPQEGTIGFFNGGWMARTRDGMRKSSKNTSWANAYTYTLYGFDRMLLKNDSVAAAYGIDHTTRLKYAENVALLLGTNLTYLSKTGSNPIDIPIVGSATATAPLTAGDLWYDMQTDQTWIYNRYQAGNIFEVLAYSEVTKDLENIQLPQTGIRQWNSEKMKQLGINQLNYMLGVNPWDVSFLLGVGDKNDAHPHHRAANPEGKNMPGSGYKYNPPTGALFGGVLPTDAWTPSTMSWEDYHIAETCIDATAMFIASCAVAVHEEDRNRAPSQISVEIRYVGYDSAIVKIAQDIRGPAAIVYSESETGPFETMFKDTVPGVAHEIHMKNLKNGTTYYFYVAAINAKSEAVGTRWLVDSTRTPYSFTTLISPAADADIQNVKVCNLSADSAEIMWYTPNGQYESKIYWDTTITSYDKMQWNTGDINADVSGIPTSFHYVKIGGLKEKTTYYYCVESNGIRRCVDDDNNPYKFKTPVRSYNFSIRTYQYESDGLDFLNLNIINNEDRAFDSLTLRLYLTATPELIEPKAGENNQPGNCPMLPDEDICQAYDEAGFNKPCETDREIRDNLRGAAPVRLEDTYNEKTGEYDWYIPVFLGSTTIKSSSRMRIDLRFAQGLYQNGKCDPLVMMPLKRMSATSGDWSWAPHLREIDGADYEGMPRWGKDEGDADQAPVNPYIVVYRKDEFVSGFSPSFKEMSTKRANYEMQLSFEPPFNVSNNSYIQIDSATSTMHLKGNVNITENGHVTSIWVNGVALTKEQMKSAAIYNVGTGRYDLNIPAKMSIGTNKVDVTVFAGPDPDCDECMENGGCAFVNRTYYVQFSKGDRTASMMQLVQEDESALSSPVPSNTKFKIIVNDKDNKNNELISVTLHNSRTKDSTQVTLQRTDENFGYFESVWLTTENVSNTVLPNIGVLGGDTITIVYIDSGDPEDSTSQYFYAKPTTPIPQTATLTDANCNSIADILTINFTGSEFDGTLVKLDSVLLKLNSPDGDDVIAISVIPSTSVLGNQAVLNLNESLIPTTTAPSGKVMLYMTEAGVIKTAEKTLSDGMAPVLTSVSILENEDHANVQDTLKLIFSEPVEPYSKTIWPIKVFNGVSEVSQSSISVISATSSDNGKSWQYVIEGNDGNAFIKKDFTAAIDYTEIIDMVGNKISDCNGPVTIIESIRPIPIQFANIVDNEGDGNPDEIYIQFTKTLREKDIPDTVDVYWGNPEIYQAFAKPANGWNFETVLGEKKAVYQTVLDSTKGTWHYTTGKKTCETKEDTTYQTTPVYKKEYNEASGDSIVTTEIDHYDTTGMSTKTVVDNKNCSTTKDSTFVPALDTIGIDSTQSQSSAIRIAIPYGMFKNKTYGSHNGNGQILPRRGPIGGFYDDNKSPLFDKCPPVLISAKLSVLEEFDQLKVISSEPLQADSLASHHYLERKRGTSTGIYLESLSSFTMRDTVQSYVYPDNAVDAVHTGDSIRLPALYSSRFMDMAGNLPTDNNPWKFVSGENGETKFSVTMLNGVATATGIETYGDFPPAENEYFRLILSKENKSVVLGLDGENLSTMTPRTELPGSMRGGPTFVIEMTLPSAINQDSVGNNLFDVSVKYTVDIFDNLGQFINTQTVNIDAATIHQIISEDGIVHLNMEWLSADGIAPKSSKNRKISTGAYIAKFNFHATETNLKTGNTTKTSSDKTRTFGFKRAK